MPDEVPAAAPAAPPAAPALAPVMEPDYDAIVWSVFNTECTNSPFFRDPQTVSVVTERFLPALLAALKKG